MQIARAMNNRRRRWKEWSVIDEGRRVAIRYAYRASTEHGRQRASCRGLRGPAHRIHHNLQVKRFFSYAQIEIKNRSGNGEHGDDEDGANERSDLHDRGPDHHHLRIFEGGQHQNFEREREEHRRGHAEREVEKKNEEGAAGVVLRQSEAAAHRLGGAEVFDEHRRQAHNQGENQKDAGNNQENKTGENGQAVQNHQTKHHSNAAEDTAKRFGHGDSAAEINFGDGEYGGAL